MTTISSSERGGVHQRLAQPADHGADGGGLVAGRHDEADPGARWPAWPPTSSGERPVLPAVRAPGEPVVGRGVGHGVEANRRPVGRSAGRPRQPLQVDPQRQHPRRGLGEPLLRKPALGHRLLHRLEGLLPAPAS